jgi:hypothetical protein
LIIGFDERGIYLAGHDLLVDLDGLVGEEGRVAGSHLIDEHAQGPPVDRLVVALQSMGIEFGNGIG